MPRSWDKALLRRLSWDLWAVEVLGLLSWAELGRGRFLLGPCPLSRLERICCKLSAFSCCLLKDAPLAILHHMCVSTCNIHTPACKSVSAHVPLTILHATMVSAHVTAAILHATIGSAHVPVATLHATLGQHRASAALHKPLGQPIYAVRDPTRHSSSAHAPLATCQQLCVRTSAAVLHAALLQGMHSCH